MKTTVHAVLRVSALERSLDFYARLFDIKIRVRTDEWAELEAGGTKLLFVKKENEEVRNKVIPIPSFPSSCYLGVETDDFILTNGTDEAIQVLINTYVDDGNEVGLLKSVLGDGVNEVARQLAYLSGRIELIDVRFVAGQLRKPRFPRSSTVSHVVDGPAKRVDMVHRLALRTRQHAHGCIE